MGIRVLNGGVKSTFQDLGRSNGLAFGIPRCGAMDQNSLRYCNSLLGNPLTEACIEFALMGPKLEFCSSLKIAITGGNFLPFINGVQVENNAVLDVDKGDVLTIKRGSNGVYGYIGVKGKFKIPSSWGSKSVYQYSNLGEVKNLSLKKGDILEVEPSVDVHNVLEPTLMSQEFKFQVFKGPEFDQFPNSSIKDFINNEFTIGIDSNRMGYRLSGNTIESTVSGNIISSGCIPGTIQVPSSGSPIVLMSDSPCTGGYPRLGILDSETLDCFAQVQPGTKVRFEWVDV